ncbi:helix-turn-helix domain-containing protein [Kitasatospora sp. NPDC058263]
MTVQDAAKYLGISVNTLYVWRHRRQGPPSFRMGPGGRVMYRRGFLDAWLAEQEGADSQSNPALNPLNTAPRPRGSARSVT